MKQKLFPGQGSIWIFLIVALIGLIIVFVSKNQAIAPSTQTPVSTDNSSPSITITVTTMPSPTPQSLLQIESSMGELNSESEAIDRGINDSQLDITQ